jgi:hypothetical protein
VHNQQDLSQLTSQQLADLAWQLKGTPAVQPVYREISRRPAKFSVKADDPDWEAKIATFLQEQLSHPVNNP